MYVVKPDSALLQTFAVDGDEHAFSEIVRRYGSFVYSTCYRVLQNRAKAEEAAQETFLKLLRKPQAVTTSLGGWLYKAASQQAIDASRSESSRRRREAAYASAPKEASSWAEISPFIDEALADMPDDMRTLLVLHFLEGRSQTDLAREMKLSVSTVCRRIKVGLHELRKRMKSRGVFVGSLAIMDFLAVDSGMTTPPALQWELRKMTMISGHGYGNGHPPTVTAPFTPDPFRIPQFASRVIGPRLRWALIITLSAGWALLISGAVRNAMSLYHPASQTPPIEDRHE